MSLWEDLEAELSAREAKSLRRTLQSVPEDALDLASNDYLGLSRHPEVIEAAQEAAARFGAVRALRDWFRGSFRWSKNWKMRLPLSRLRGCTGFFERLRGESGRDWGFVECLAQPRGFFAQTQSRFNSGRLWARRSRWPRALFPRRSPFTRSTRR
jgi:hypothetical protein